MVILTLSILSITSESCGNSKVLINEKIYFFPLKEIPEFLDPARIESEAEASIIGEIYDGLVYLDENFEAKPEIAESWDYEPDIATYTFQIRDNVKFHNGLTVTAEDVKYSFERIISSDLHAPGNITLELIKGSNNFKNRKSDNISGIRIIDDKTIEIELTKNFIPFIKLLSSPEFSIVSKAAVEDYDKGSTPTLKPVGTGPFKFDSKNSDGSLLLRSNPEYYLGKPKLDGILYKLVSDDSQMLAEYRKGMLHHVPVAKKEIRDEILQDESIMGEIVSYPINGFYFFAFNLDKTQFGGLENREGKRLVRQALNFAIDRENICKSILWDSATPWVNVIPDNLFGYENPISINMSFGYDVSAARRLLSQAGFPEGKGFQTITINTLPDAQNIAIAEAIKNNFNEIGINAEIDTRDFDEHSKMIIENRLSFFLFVWGMDDPIIRSYFSLFHGKYARGGLNVANLTRDYINELIDKTEKTDDPDALNELYRELEKELWYDSPLLLLYQEKNALLINENVVGLKEQLCQLDFGTEIQHVRMDQVDIEIDKKGKKDESH